jgi:DNA-binding GntR family transcriptional regulator
VDDLKHALKAHSVEAHCSRWIVATHDQVKRDDLPPTHESLAETLGVQRSSVSTVIQGLQRRGLIRQGRGSITVVDRPGLQEAACEFYGILRERYLQMLPNAPR